MSIVQKYFNIINNANYIYEFHILYQNDQRVK